MVPVRLIDDWWRPESLERLAHAYWAYLRRISLGLIRVSHEETGPTVVIISRRLPLLRFRRPDYRTGPDFARVTWPIERGLLVASAGRGRGYLRITVRRAGDDAPGTEPATDAGMTTIHVAAEVANFYPGLRFHGRLARLGAALYNQTQMRLHVIVTRGFLRSLTRLDLPETLPGGPGSAGPGG